MPWQETCAMDLRRSLIDDWLAEAWTVTELCELYGVSRKTAYKWFARFEQLGVGGLADQSRRPHHPAGAVAPALAAAVCEARRRQPRWGARKIRAWLRRRQPKEAWPSHVTIAAIWRRHGVVGPVGPRPVPIPPPRVGARARTPNAVWTIDFKGDFRLGSGERCYPLTLRDAASRYTLRCAGLRAPDLAATARHVRRTFAEFGLPDCIRSDNGAPFAGQGLGGISQLSLWWMRLNIRVERIAPGHPEQNGSHEQFHRVLKAATTRPPATTLGAQQRRFTVFCREYNEDRPHAALGDAVPADRYRPSARALPTRLPPLTYPGHWDVHTVAPNGSIHWRGDRLFLSRALAGQRVGLEEVDDGIWTVYFAQTPLARYHARGRRLRPVRD